MDPATATVVVALIAAAASTYSAYLANRNRKQTNLMHEQAAEIHEQVKNTHTTNLREDIDRILESCEKNTRDIQELKGLYTESNNRLRGIAGRVTALERRTKRGQVRQSA